MIHVIHAHAPTYVKYREVWVGEGRKGGQGKKGAREIMDKGDTMSSLAVLTRSPFSLFSLRSRRNFVDWVGQWI